MRFLVEVPFLRLGADRSAGRGRRRRAGAFTGGTTFPPTPLLDVAIVDGDDRDAGVEVRLDAGADAALVAALPAAAVDVEDDRRRLVGLRLPEVEHLPFVRAVVHGRGGPLRQGGQNLLGCLRGRPSSTFFLSLSCEWATRPVIAKSARTTNAGSNRRMVRSPEVTRAGEAGGVMVFGPGPR